MNINCQVLAYNKVSQSEQKTCKLSANVKENLSQLVQRRIKELGISKAEIARRTGLSRTYITDIANSTGNTQSGQYNLTPETVAKFSKALEITEAEILEAMSYLKNIKPYPKELVMDYDGFDDDDLKDIAAYIEFRKQRKEAEKNK